MSSLNRVTLIGKLGKDPEVRYTTGGKAVANFSLATAERFKKNDEWQESTEWHNIQAWDKLAEICGEWLQKGKLVFIEGRIQTRKWQDKDGKDRYTTEILADKMLMLDGKKDETHRTHGSNGGGSGYMDEPAFDLESNIPFLAPAHWRV